MRMHPILGYTRMHKGVDFGVPTGTPIYAAGEGTIEFAGWAGGYGRFVKIKHNPHMETAYGHMSRIALNINSRPACVPRVRSIGYVGMTGDATGPHLHYEVLKRRVAGQSDQCHHSGRASAWKAAASGRLRENRR